MLRGACCAVHAVCGACCAVHAARCMLHGACCTVRCMLDFSRHISKKSDLRKFGTSTERDWHRKKFASDGTGTVRKLGRKSASALGETAKKV